jgi:hypothetical protein
MGDAGSGAGEVNDIEKLELRMDAQEHVLRKLIVSIAFMSGDRQSVLNQLEDGTRRFFEEDDELTDFQKGYLQLCIDRIFIMQMDLPDD